MAKIDFSNGQTRADIAQKMKAFDWVIGGYLNRNKGLPILQVDGCSQAVCSAYWLLNTSYKEKWLAPGTLTNSYKRAAIQCCAVMAIRPLVPAQPHNITSSRVLLCNQELAFAWSSATVERARLAPDDENRQAFDKWLDHISFPSIERYLDDVRNGADTDNSEYDINISDLECHMIDAVIFRLEHFRHK